MPTLRPEARLLVTGGAGFVGSWLVERWVARGGTATVLDDFSAGGRANLAGVERTGAVRVVEGSVLDAALVDALVRESDGVAHLACVVGVERVLAEPLRTLEVATRGGENVLDACARSARPVLVVSSSEVYGPANRARLHESDPLGIGGPENPRWTYALGKAHTEALALALARERSLPAVVVRLFNTSGPRQVGSAGMVVPRFCAAALADEPLLVHGDGTQRRVFCHVEDAVEAIARLLLAPAARGRVVNVGGTEEVTIAGLAARVCRIARSRSPIVRAPHGAARGRHEDDAVRRVPDIERAHELVGWRPERSLDRLIHDVCAALRGDGGAVPGSPEPRRASESEPPR